MTFTVFLLSGVVFVLLLLVLICINNYANNKNENETENWFQFQLRWFYFGCFVLLGLCAAWTVNTYLYPKDTKAFDSTDYHLLENLGFQFDNQLNLVSLNPPEGYPDGAFWDNKTGKVDLLRDSKEGFLPYNVYFPKDAKPYVCYVDKNGNFGDKIIIDYFRKEKDESNNTIIYFFADEWNGEYQFRVDSDENIIKMRFVSKKMDRKVVIF